MTEKDAKETLEIFEMQRNKYMVNMPNNPYFDMVTDDKFTHSLRMAIQALEEIQQYRSIGTVEECREAVERQRGKKPVKYDNCGNKTVAERCQNCFEIVGGKYCENCGQRILLKESED